MKNKRSSKAVDTGDRLIIRGEVENFEIGAFACDVILLAIFLCNELCYGMHMPFLTIPLFLIGLYFLLFELIPEQYCFTDTALEIRHRFRKTTVIAYDAFFNFEATEHDSFINILRNNSVKVYYTVGKSRRATVCRPRNVSAFTDALKKYCPEFQAEEQTDSRLNIFFEK